MFLNELNDMEKEAFLSLSVHVANANDTIEESEVAIIGEYIKEMNLGLFDINTALSMEEIVDIVTKSSYRHKKIIMLEIIGLAYVDNEYDDREKSIVDEFSKKIALEDDDIKHINIVIDKYMSVLKEVSDVIA